MNQKKKIQWTNLLCGLIALFLASNFKLLSLWLGNLREIGLTDTYEVMGLCFGLGLLLFGLYLLMTRSLPKSIIAAVIACLVLFNFTGMERLLQKLIPSLRYHQIVFLIVFGFYLLGSLIRMIPGELASFLNKGICLMLVLVLAIPLAKNAGDLFHAGNEVLPENVPADVPAASEGDLPNFYYLLFDEYAGLEEIRDYFDYDNSSFAEWLSAKGFTVSPDSHNESVRTDVVTTNLTNLEYLIDPDTPDRTTPRIDNALFPLLRAHGYEVIGGPGADFYGLATSNVGGGNVAQTVEGFTVAQTVLQTSVFYPFISQNSDQVAENMKTAFETLKHPEDFPSRNAFILAHIGAPHIPYLFHADGSLNTRVNFYNNTDPFYYVQYYRYVTTEMQQIVDAILAQDADAVIILTSDHGNRFPSTLPFEAKSNVLNAVYFRGEAIPEIMGQSGVNTLRLVLNRLIGTDYGILEVPRYEKE